MDGKYMAGSYNHIVDNDGNFKFDSIENMGDAYECIEECFWLINYLSNGDRTEINKAIAMMYSKEKCGIVISPKKGG